MTIINQKVEKSRPTRYNCERFSRNNSLLLLFFFLAKDTHTKEKAALCVALSKLIWLKNHMSYNKEDFNQTKLLQLQLLLRPNQFQEIFHKLCQGFFPHAYCLVFKFLDDQIGNFVISQSGSIALPSHFHKVLALSKFALLKCEIHSCAVEPCSTDSPCHQHCGISICVTLAESVLWGSLHFRTLKVRILKVLILCESAKVKQYTL